MLPIPGAVTVIIAIVLTIVMMMVMKYLLKCIFNMCIITSSDWCCVSLLGVSMVADLRLFSPQLERKVPNRFLSPLQSLIMQMFVGRSVIVDAYIVDACIVTSE